MIGIDISGSTRGSRLASLYEAAADGAIDTAAHEHLEVLLEAFTDASSSAQLVYVDSFASATGADVLDLANNNRVRCQADRAVHDLLTKTPRSGNTGTDVGGNLAELVARARDAVIARKPAYVLDLTDGLTEPSRRGTGGHDLVDLRRLLRHETPSKILRDNPSAFTIGDARGVAVTMKGIDRESSAALASSANARALTELWTRACQRAHAKSCDVTEEVP